MARITDCCARDPMSAMALDKRSRPRSINRGKMSSAEFSANITLCKLVARVLENVPGGTILDQPAIVQESCNIGYSSSLLHVMRNNNHRVLLFQLTNQLFNHRGRNRVKS